MTEWEQKLIMWQHWCRSYCSTGKDDVCLGRQGWHKLSSRSWRGTTRPGWNRTEALGLKMFHKVMSWNVRGVSRRVSPQHKYAQRRRGFMTAVLKLPPLCSDVKWLNLTGGQRRWKQQRSKRGTEDKRCWSRGEEGQKGIDGTELSVVVTPLYEYLLKTLNARNLHSMTHNDAPRSRNTLEIYRHHV